MFLEFISDLLMNSSMFYVYFGVLLVTIGFTHSLFMKHLGSRENMFSQTMYVSMLPSNIEHIHVHNEPFIVWFRKSCKRMYTTDDDLEDDNSSYFTRARKIRGGQLWKKTTYAPRSVNTELVLSVLY